MPRLTEQELATRHLGLGSTDIVEACGLAPWKGAGPMRLYCEKVGIKPPDDAEDDDRRHDWLAWGHVQEEVIATWYAGATGRQVDVADRVETRGTPLMWATLDRVADDRLVECKNVGSPALYRHWDASSEDGIPNYVRAQVTVAMAISSIHLTDVAAAIGGRPPHVWTVFYDPELAKMLLDGARRFWSLVESRTPPPLDATPATRAYLLDKYPANRERVVRAATEDEHAIGQCRVEADRGLRDAKARSDTATARLLAAVGDADGIEGDGWKMTWKLDKNGVRRPRFTTREERE